MNSDSCLEIDRLIRDHCWAEALEELDGVLARRPGDEKLLARRVLADWNLHHFDRMAEAAETLVATRPDAAEGHHWRSEAHWENGEIDQALEHVSRALERDPEHFAARVRQCLCLARQSRWPECFEVASSLCDDEPRSQSVSQLVFFLFAESKWPWEPDETELEHRVREMPRATSTLIEERQDSAAAWALHGWALLRSGERKGAHAAFERAIELDRRCEPARNGIYTLGVRPPSRLHPVFDLLHRLDRWQFHSPRRLPDLGLAGGFIAALAMTLGTGTYSGRITLVGVIGVLVAWILSLLGSSRVVAWTLFATLPISRGIFWGRMAALISSFAVSQVLIVIGLAYAWKQSPSGRFDWSCAAIVAALVVTTYPVGRLTYNSLARPTLTTSIAVQISIGVAVVIAALGDWVGVGNALLFISAAAGVHFLRADDHDHRHNEYRAVLGSFY